MNEWNTLCLDEEFGEMEADIACEQLGYTEAIEFTTSTEELGYTT